MLILEWNRKKSRFEFNSIRLKLDSTWSDLVRWAFTEIRKFFRTTFDHLRYFAKFSRSDNLRNSEKDTRGNYESANHVNYVPELLKISEISSRKISETSGKNLKFLIHLNGFRGGSVWYYRSLVFERS